MANMTSVIVFTVTNVNPAQMEQFRSQFSQKIGKAVKAHVKSNTVLIFSALAPQSTFTAARWAGVLRSVCASRNPVQWEIEEVMDW
jgi:hypothetical protein